MMEVKKTSKSIGENLVRAKPFQKSSSSSIITGRSAFGEVGNKLPLAKKADVPLKGGIRNQENLIRKPIQKSVSSTLVSCRPALGEVGNKINQVKKPEVVLKKTVQEKLSKLDLHSAKPESKISDKFHLDHKSLFARKDSNLKHLLPQQRDAVKVVSYSSNQLKEIIDIDENTSDPMLVGDYIKDIMNYLLELEDQFQIKEKFLLDGHESTPRMRSVLLNWLVEVHDNFKLLAETLHLTVAIVDRFLQKNKTIGRQNLQLVGVAALLLASKYEEMYFPDIEDFVYVCDDTFTKKEIFCMEINILKALEFNLGRPLPLHFLRRYNKIAKAPAQHHMLGKYLLELIIDEHALGHIKPSLQAAAASYLSKQIYNETQDPKEIWDETMIHYTSYSLVDVQKVSYEIAALLVRAPKHKFQATRTKYSQSNYYKISTISKLSSPLVLKYAKQAKVIKV